MYKVNVHYGDRQQLFDAPDRATAVEAVCKILQAMQDPALGVPILACIIRIPSKIEISCDGEINVRIPSKGETDAKG